MDAVDASPEGDVRTARATLASVLENLGLDVLQILVAPGGLDVDVGELVIWEEEEHELELRPAAVILAVGVDAGSHQAGHVVEQAARAGCAAVVVKLRSAPSPTLVDTARSEGVALLGVPKDVAWGQLHSLFRVAMTVVGMPGTAAADAPVGDLFALANAVAAMVGGATTIEDRHSTVLAYSSTEDPLDEGRRQTILGRRVPEKWLDRLGRDGVFRKLWSSTDVVLVEVEGEDPPIRRRLAVAVRAGDEVLGSIWVLEGARPFGPEAEEALREAARIAPLHMLRHRVGEDLERRRRGELLRLALDGRLPPDLNPWSLGVPHDARMAVAAFEVGPAAEPAALVTHAERVANLISVYCEAYRRQAAVVAHGPVVYVLFAVSETTTLDEVVDVVGDVIRRSQGAVSVELRAGVGSLVDGIGHVDSSRREADQVLRVLARNPAPATAHIEDVRSEVVLLQLHDMASMHPELTRGKLDALIEHDERECTAYIASLRTHLETFGDVRTAAGRLNVHPNTLRYRLRRIEELSGLDLAHPADRLVAQLQLFLRDL